jgi:hypothetical protein
MNKFIIFWGAVLLVAAGGMYLLLYELSLQTFRPRILPYENTALAAILVGTVVLIAGLVLRPTSINVIETKKAAKYFWYFALTNAVIAAILIAPILDPTYKFPILITQWPGIYMVIAYSMFLVVGVLGMLGWSAAYHLSSSLNSKDLVDKRLVILQIALAEFGICGLLISMFVGGYEGAALLYQGAGAVEVGIVMEVGVIPAGVSIFILIISTLMGVANLLLAKKEATFEKVITH